MLAPFPDFKPLGLEDKDEYNRLIAEFPGFADISFSNLHIWWNLDGKLAVCQLNNNLIINYSLPFAPEDSGITLIGKQRAGESIQELFAYLKSHERAVKLVHVPEFVVESISDKSRLLIEEEPIWHEYIMDSQALASLEHSSHGRTRRKVARFIRETEDSELNLMSLDLSSTDAKKLILDSVMEWEKKYPSQNDPARIEKSALEKTLQHCLALDTNNLCLFIDGRLQAVILYHLTADKKHYIINHFRVDYQIPFIFDYMTQQLAKKAIENQVPYLNMEMDLGLEGLRKHKLGLRPIDFYKKFTIRPSA